MINNANELISKFTVQTNSIGLMCGAIDHELQSAPHTPHALPKGKCAVYVFSLSAAYGKTCEAGSGKVLKVGFAGAKSNARFQSHHYGSDRARSTLAGFLLDSKLLWSYLGISSLSELSVERWLKENTDRDNFYLDGRDEEAGRQLERFLRAYLGPMSEGGKTT